MSCMAGSGWDNSSAGDANDNESVIELAKTVTSDATATATVATCVVGERTGRKVLLAYRPTT